jgi:hypothetical protein
MLWRNRNPVNLRKRLGIFLFIPASLLGCYLIWGGSSVHQLHARLSFFNSVEVGYDGFPLIPASSNERIYRQFMRWRRGPIYSTFTIYESGDRFVDTLELRATTDRSKVWVVNMSNREVIASLDIQTGEFLGLNTGEKHRPAWSTASGGVVLDRFERLNGSLN